MVSGVYVDNSSRSSVKQKGFKRTEEPHNRWKVATKKETKDLFYFHIF